MCGDSTRASKTPVVEGITDIQLYKSEAVGIAHKKHIFYSNRMLFQHVVLENRYKNDPSVIV